MTISRKTYTFIRPKPKQVGFVKCAQFHFVYHSLKIVLYLITYKIYKLILLK